MIIWPRPPVDERVIGKMSQYLGLSGCFGNPASNHRYGFSAQEAITQSRAQVAKLIGAKAQEIIWTSGATESNNLALKGAFHYYKAQGNHIITSTIEHRAVLDPCADLSKLGANVTYLRPQSNGLIDPSQLTAAMRPETRLVSIAHVNNEIGVIQDLKKIGKIIKTQGALFHVDAAQSAGKIPINVNQMQIDLLSLSAHKLYGPKGIGALYIRSQPRIFLKPLIHGGSHERGLRAGTLATHQIVGMGEAFNIATTVFDKDAQKIAQQSKRIIHCLKQLPGIYFHGDLTARYPGNINFRVDGIHGESLLFALQPLAISRTAACTDPNKMSHVLLALGFTDREAADAIRLSIGRYTTDEEIDFVCKHLTKQILALSKLAPPI